MVSCSHNGVSRPQTLFLTSLGRGSQRWRGYLPSQPYRTMYTRPSISYLITVTMSPSRAVKISCICRCLCVITISLTCDMAPMSTQHTRRPIDPENDRYKYYQRKWSSLERWVWFERGLDLGAQSYRVMEPSLGPRPSSPQQRPLSYVFRSTVQTRSGHAVS